MAINKIEIGERYSDDSGWERRVEVERHSNSLKIDICGSGLRANADEIDWLIASLTKAKSIIEEN